MEPEVEAVGVQKRRKVRAAWISFTGRIIAQLIGAVATVGLGVVVLGGRLSPVKEPVASQVTAREVLVARPVRTSQGTVMVLVPLDRSREVTSAMVEELAAGIEADSPRSGDIQTRAPVRAAANAH